MNGKVRVWLFASLVVFSTTIVPAVAGELPPMAKARIESLISQLMKEQGIPGMSAAIATDSDVCYSKGFGEADVENGVPATPETRYRTASIAKSLTAALILSLMEEGRLDLDQEVQHYCPEFPKKEFPITTRQLLGHLAGIRHYKNPEEAASTQHFFNLKSALTTFCDDPLLCEPGTKFHYTTFGYNLLGTLAETAGERSFVELLSEKLLRPAGMKDTVVDDHFALIHGRTRGYIRATKSVLEKLPAGHNLIEGRLYNAPLHDTSMKIPGGGLLSTAPDLVRFAAALHTGKLLKRATCELMWTIQKTADGKETGYGLGWRIKRHSGRKVVWHTGGQSGTSTVLVLFPETGTSVALMSNLQHARLLNSALAIADIVQPPAPPMSEQTDYEDALKKLETAIRYEMERKQLPAFSISLVDGDRIIFAEGFGFQDARKKIPATADTVYRVGSVSKLFTDIAVMQLVEKGRLDLDAPVTKYLPNFQPKNPYDIPITLRQLMSHRSGLVRESPVGNYFDPDEPTLAETVASLNTTSLVYKPETMTKYSNAAIAVVGAILEKQLGSSHPDRVRETILDPLGMKDSSFILTPAVREKLAAGFMHTYDGRRFEAPQFLLGTGPAGNMYSSVRDLSKFIICLFNEGTSAKGQILKPETLKVMLTPIPGLDGKPERFGLGFHVEELDGYKKIGHGGAVYGFSTQLEALPERKVGAAAVASLDVSNGVVSRLTDYALRLLIAAKDGKPLPSYRMTGPIPPERAREIVGMYREKDGKRFTRITELNGEVFMQRGAVRYRLGAAADDGRIVTDDLQGFGMEVKLEEGNRLLVDNITFERLPDAPPADIPGRWKGLIGEYGWDHNTLFILEEDGQLYALIEWFYYYPLKEVNENVYEFPDYGLYHGEGLEFRRNAQGTATEVVAASVRFQRRDVGTKDGETFRIRPVKPIEDLRSAALSASPPEETGTFREQDLVELTLLEPAIKKDIRYATTNNFMGSVFYKQAQAFMQRPAAEAVVRAHRRLKSRGLGLLIHDAYRPWYVTKMFWDATPDDLKQFVANAANGSRHNRGCAVDLTLYDLQTGAPIPMVAGYDEFSPRSFPLYPGGTSRQRWFRGLLRRTMEAEGFTIYDYEWWHFDYKDWKQYRIGNTTFENLEKP